MVFFEAERSEGKEYLFFSLKQNLRFPLHFHRSFEVIYVREGMLTLQTNGKSYPVHAGDVGVVLPEQLHSYDTTDFSETELYIFSYDYLFDFYRLCKGKEAVPPVFTPSNVSLFTVLQSQTENRYRIKGALYNLAGQFLASCPLQEKSSSGVENLLEKIIRDVQSSYRSPLSLRELAARTGYQYNYLSAYFHAKLGMNFTEFVNRYRLEDAADQLLQSDRSIADIAMDCGFGSIRNFNRCFTRIYRQTPSEYRTFPQT